MKWHAKFGRSLSCPQACCNSSQLYAASMSIDSQNFSLNQKDSLGGNSKTVMVATVSPAADNYEVFSVFFLRHFERRYGPVLSPLDCPFPALPEILCRHLWHLWAWGSEGTWKWGSEGTCKWKVVWMSCRIACCMRVHDVARRRRWAHCAMRIVRNASNATLLSTRIPLRSSFASYEMKSTACAPNSPLQRSSFCFSLFLLPLPSPFSLRHASFTPSCFQISLPLLIYWHTLCTFRISLYNSFASYSSLSGYEFC